MRVALLSGNAQQHDAVGNQVAAKAAFFVDHGADVRVFVQSSRALHPGLRGLTQVVERVERAGPAWEFLAGADIVWAEYAQFYDLLHFLPLLAGGKPRIVVEYHGITPSELWRGPGLDRLQQAASQRNVVWCADAVVVHSDFTRRELVDGTGYPAERVYLLGCALDDDLLKMVRHVGVPALAGKLPPKGGTPTGKCTLLFVGRIAGNKRVPVLLEALTHLDAGVEAEIIGDVGDVYAEEVRRCQELAERLGVAKRVRWRGQVSRAELARAYREADILVLPSRHEGFCVPVVEAMAAGLPVVAARAGALPETVAGAGVTFSPDDAVDLARQVRRVLSADSGKTPKTTYRVAVVSFRFGEKVGGAETSLRTMARSLKHHGHTVEVFTTCNRRESAWRNELPAGTDDWQGIPIHHFPIDDFSLERHGQAFRSIVEAEGRVSAEVEDAYLRHGLHASSLLRALKERGDEFDAIITGPYLFGLTHDLAREFADKLLLVPCFHDEPLVRLNCWRTYEHVAGVLYHTVEEQQFAEVRLGLNHPRGCVVGTWLEAGADPRDSLRSSRGMEKTLVYCGRLTTQKNVPMLIDFVTRYQREKPGRFACWFVGDGEVDIPTRPGLKKLGWVSEEDKRRVLASAAALVQLSSQESLSLVLLEAWAQGTPALVQAECAVLRGQMERADGGAVVGDYASFAAALDDLWERPDVWRQRGQSGQAFVRKEYGSQRELAGRLERSLADMRVPLAECMRRQGLERARRWFPEAWRTRLGGLVETVLEGERTDARQSLTIQVWQEQIVAAAGSGHLLLPVRLVNNGDRLWCGAGPEPVELCSRAAGEVCTRTRAPDWITPAQTCPAALQVLVPDAPGEYRLELWAEQAGREIPTSCTVLTVTVGPTRADKQGMLSNPCHGIVAQVLALAQRQQQLPTDYVDVSEGFLARGKRWLKKKLLGNFKSAYVDVLSRQQSHVNQHLIQAIGQLAEYCQTLEHSVQVLQKGQQSRASGEDDHNLRRPLESRL